MGPLSARPSPGSSSPGPLPASAREAAVRAADLVNVLCVADPSPAAVAAVLRAHGETEPAGLAAAGVAAMRREALRLRAVFTAPDLDAAARELNGLLASVPGRLRLSAHGGRTPWHPHLDGDDDAPWAEWLLASSCLALTVLLWERQRPPGALCASPACGRVFVTAGGGPARRYCSRRCATRERVAAHRREHR
jgi:predicted RNA-binding Zn ribbon-like protein